VPQKTQLTPRSPIPRLEIAKRYGSITADGNNPPWDSLDADRRADLATRMATFAGMVSGMDRNIGRLVADLQANRELDRTLILFMSDNGACPEWEPFGFDMSQPANIVAGTGIGMGTQTLPNILHRGAKLALMGRAGSWFSYGSAWANASNTPWRLYKHYSHEGGISSPLIVHWPEGVKARGAIRTQPVHIIDVMATFVDITGAAYPKERNGTSVLPMEGVTFRPTFADRPLARKIPLFFEHTGSRAVRDGKWKLVGTQDGEWELYDMDTDRTEMNDLAARRPEKVRELSTLWEQWAQRTHVLLRPGGK
jgi:arylsulfatase